MVTSSVAHGKAFTSTAAQNTVKGWAFTVYKSTYSIVSVTKNSLCTATAVRLSTHADGSDNLGEANFVGDLATFAIPLALSLNGKYYILVMNTGVLNHRITANQNYPIAGVGDINTFQITGQSNDGVDYGNGQPVFNFDSCLLSEADPAPVVVIGNTKGEKELRTNWDSLTASDITKAVGHIQNLIPTEGYNFLKKELVGL